jgi:hypothetical protein|tara:strand:+ start:962 stop:1450 length:489 start_codon:yes stop_codon:yes gene_type:complete
MGVEIQTQQSFSIALGADGLACRAVFKAAVNANARLAMANEAITYALKELGEECDLLPRWNKLYARAKKLAKRRNAIAHGRAAVVMGQPNDEGVSHGLGARISDPLDFSSTPPDPKKQLVEGISVDQLIDLANRFHRLAHDIFTHGQEMGAALRKLRESRGQ